MPRALEIPIEVTGLERAQSNLRQFTESVRRVGATADRMERQVQRTLTVSGPAQRLQRANAALEAAQESGDAARIFDAQAAVARATIGMQRARRQQALSGGGGFMDRLTGVLASTRFNAGPVSPLVGRAAELAGIPLTGATGLMIGGSMAALGAFTLAIKSATDTLNTFGEAMRLTGGTAHETAQMARFGFTGAAGAQAAAGFRQRIATDPMAMMFAAQLGIRALPRPFGQVDEAGLIVRAARSLEQMTNAEERLRIERELGLESVERYIQASPRLKAVLDMQAQFEERLGEGAKGANDLSLATEALQRSWQDLLAVLATPTIEFLADDLERLAAFFHGDWATAFGDNVGSKNDALDKNTDALNTNTDAMKGVYLQPGEYGGGPRARGAVPGGWSGDFLARQMESGALGRGARLN